MMLIVFFKYLLNQEHRFIKFCIAFAFAIDVICLLDYYHSH